MYKYQVSAVMWRGVRHGAVYEARRCDGAWGDGNACVSNFKLSSAQRARATLIDFRQRLACRRLNILVRCASASATVQILINKLEREHITHMQMQTLLNYVRGSRILSHSSKPHKPLNR